jgi:hypothetical protein
MNLEGITGKTKVMPNGEKEKANCQEKFRQEMDTEGYQASWCIH